MMVTGKSRSTCRENRPSATFFTSYPIWTNLGMNRNLVGQCRRQRQKCGTALLSGISVVFIKTVICCQFILLLPFVLQTAYTKQFHGCPFICVVISLSVFGSFSSCFNFLICLLCNAFLLCYCVQTVHTSHCMVLSTWQCKQIIFLNAHFPVPHS